LKFRKSRPRQVGHHSIRKRKLQYLYA